MSGIKHAFFGVFSFTFLFPTLTSLLYRTMSAQILHDSKFAIEEQMKTLPDIGKADDSDFAAWGASFCALVVSLFDR